MSIAGISLDTVHEVYRLDQAFDERREDLEPNNATRVLKHCATYTPAGADGPERLLGVLIGELDFTSTKFFPARPEGPLLDSVFAYLEFRALGDDKAEPVASDEGDVFGRFRFWRTYFNLATTRWLDRALAVTSGGRLAIVPSHSKVGDTVCLFLGATHPQVLSRREDGKHWTYIGPTVVDGLMTGEFFETTENWMSKKETFRLK